MCEEDTIAAISTPYGSGGIGIIRISGIRAFEIAGRIFKGRKPFESLPASTISYGKVVDPRSGEVLDEVLISKMKKPATFTREDVVEINCHGGIVVLRRILELVIAEGARLAEPGEFTKRAFLNGRIDLSQAEAVIDLINSKTSKGSRAAMDQLDGKLSKKIQDIRNLLIGLIAHIEVTVDYPEHDIEEITGKEVYNKIKDIRDELAKLLKSFERGRIIRDGISVVIVGRPNVGKSSLMNELTGKNRAIVTDIPGTTRDIIEEYINIDGIPVKIADTAGIRETSNVVEKIGVERTEKEIGKADLVIMVLDASEGILDGDMDIFKKVKGKKTILLLNKIDIGDKIPNSELFEKFCDTRAIRASVKKEIGLDELEKEISGMFMEGGINAENEILITNVRHKRLIESAIGSINEAISGYESGMPLDCITIDIMDAANCLGRITGESVSEDVIQEIFSRFCVGK